MPEEANPEVHHEVCDQIDLQILEEQMARREVVSIDWSALEIPDPDPLSDPLNLLIHEEEEATSKRVIALRARYVRNVLSRLPALERRIIRWRYGVGCQELSDQQIADRLNLSRSGVWRIRQRALARLRGDELPKQLKAA